MILRSSLLVVFLVAPDPFFRAWVPFRVHCSKQFLSAHSERSTWPATWCVDQPAVFIPMIRPLSNSLNCGAGWRRWSVAGSLHPKLRVRPRPKSVDFDDAENRHEPCGMIICSSYLGEPTRDRDIGRKEESGALKKKCCNCYIQPSSEFQYGDISQETFYECVTASESSG
ncbi:uncharacterized protein TNCV_1917891 [Trichonephila clavipes]|uniref:Secreted protein n=1 Tax=Trichonephila clavipes TaxID=2585209 RepID=A0A8X6W0Z7_TRICX|nr:uncharacterized protein TNCV_1917891 [Trichonephila clavipes]